MVSNASDSSPALPSITPNDRGMVWVVVLVVVIHSGTQIACFHGSIAAGAMLLAAKLLLVLGVWWLARRLLRADAAPWAALALTLYLSLFITSLRPLIETGGLALLVWSLVGHSLWADANRDAKRRMAGLGLWGLSSVGVVLSLGMGCVPLLLAYLYLSISKARRQHWPHVAHLLVLSVVMLAVLLLHSIGAQSCFFSFAAFSVGGWATSLHRLLDVAIRHPILPLGLLGALLRAVWARRPADQLTLGLLGWLLVWEVFQPKANNSALVGYHLMPLAALFSADWLAAAWAWARSPFRHRGWRWVVAIALGLLMLGYR